MVVAVSVRSHRTINKTVAYRLVGIQQLVTIALTLLLFVILGKIPAYSAFLGGLAYIVPNAYFVACAFRDMGQASSPEATVRWFYISEVGKLVLTGLIFALCFVLVEPLHVISLFVTYIMMMMINLTGLSLLSSDGKKNLFNNK